MIGPSGDRVRRGRGARPPEGVATALPGSPHAHRTSGRRITVCRRDGLTPAGAPRFDVEGVAVAVVRIDDEAYAVGDRGTSKEVSLSEGEVDKVERLLECSKHGSQFSPVIGELLQPPSWRRRSTRSTSDPVTRSSPCRERTDVARGGPTGRAPRSALLDRLAPRRRRCRDPSRQRSPVKPDSGTFAREGPHRNEHADG